jgi:hypothetical protein
VLFAAKTEEQHRITAKIATRAQRRKRQRFIIMRGISGIRRI